MKQIEVTVRVNNTLKEIDKILSKKGFSIIRTSRVEDCYLTQKMKKLDKKHIINVLNSSVLVRYLRVDNNAEFKKITYKIKKYNRDKVISEQKINVNIDNIDNAIELFLKLGFEKLVYVKYDVIVYSNGKEEFAFQNVDDLGLLLEYEHTDDFTGYSDRKIISVKKKMLDVIKSYGIDVDDDYDVKKAYELILSKLNGED